MELVWEKRSARLWVADHNGRRFRIERTGSSSNSTGGYVATEVDDRFREYQRAPGNNMTAVRKVVAMWLTTPRPDQPSNVRKVGMELGYGMICQSPVVRK